MSKKKREKRKQEKKIKKSAKKKKYAEFSKVGDVPPRLETPVVDEKQRREADKSYREAMRNLKNYRR